MFSPLLEFVADSVSATIEVLCTVFTLAFGISVAGAVVYIAGTVAYNVMLARKRREARERQNPPEIHVKTVVYPDGREEVIPSDAGAVRESGSDSF